MQQELPTGRRAIPLAFALSMLLHSLLIAAFLIRPHLLAEPPPAPEPSVPVAFVPAPPAPPRTPAEPLRRFEFPDAPATDERVESAIRSDRNRKAQTRDRSQRTAPGGKTAPPAPAVPPKPPALPPDPAPQPRKPSESPPAPERAPAPDDRPTSSESQLARQPGTSPPQTAPVPAPQSTREPRPDASGKTAFDRQFDQLHVARGSGLLNPTVLQGSAAGEPDGVAGGARAGNDLGGLLSFDTQADELGPYARILYLRIKAAWILPQMAKDFAKGVTEVKFVISRAGRIESVRVSSSSGWVPLDNAAVNAVRGAAPLPPLPESFPAERVGVTFRFYVNLPIPAG